MQGKFLVSSGELGLTRVSQPRSQQSWATLALPELSKTYQFMQHPTLYRQMFIFTSQIVVKRERDAGSKTESV